MLQDKKQSRKDDDVIYAHILNQVGDMEDQCELIDYALIKAYSREHDMSYVWCYNQEILWESDQNYSLTSSDFDTLALA